MMNAKWVVGELRGVLLVAFDIRSSKYTVYRIPGRTADAPRSPPARGAGFAGSIAPACYPKGDLPGGAADLSYADGHADSIRKVDPKDWNIK